MGDLLFLGKDAHEVEELEEAEYRHEYMQQRSAVREAGRGQRGEGHEQSPQADGQEQPIDRHPHGAQHAHRRISLQCHCFQKLPIQMGHKN